MQVSRCIYLLKALTYLMFSPLFKPQIFLIISLSVLSTLYFLFIFLCTVICDLLYSCFIAFFPPLQVIHSRPQDLLPKPIEEDDPSLQRPDQEAIDESTEKTRLALEKLVSGKISAAMPVRHAEKQAPAQYIRCLPSKFVCKISGGFFCLMPSVAWQFLRMDLDS